MEAEKKNSQIAFKTASPAPRRAFAIKAIVFTAE
jgi:hypothetical protein